MNNSPQNPNTMNTLALAYIGDSVYDLHIRQHLVLTAPAKVNDLHKRATAMVNASAQAASFRQIQHILTEEELAIFRRGRNANSSPPKNANPADYRTATGIETLIGYIFLTGNIERLNQIMRAIINGSNS